jgi:hypothetical protein
MPVHQDSPHNVCVPRRVRVGRSGRAGGLDEPPRPANRAVDPRLVRRRDRLHQHRIIGTDADCLNFRRGLRPADPRHGSVPRLGGQIHSHRQHLATLRPAHRRPQTAENSSAFWRQRGEAARWCGWSELAGRMEPDEQLQSLPPSGNGDTSPAGALRGLPADSRTPAGASQYRADQALRESPPRPGRRQLRVTPPPPAQPITVLIALRSRAASANHDGTPSSSIAWASRAAPTPPPASRRRLASAARRSTCASGCFSARWMVADGGRSTEVVLGSSTADPAAAAMHAHAARRDDMWVAADPTMVG